jgi:hypothetical protein
VHVSHGLRPAGRALGHLIAAMLGKNPKRVVREDLRNFKRMMEIGEILTIIGQPHGTCTGQGKPYTESNGVRCSLTDANVIFYRLIANLPSTPATTTERNLS